MGFAFIVYLYYFIYPKINLTKISDENPEGPFIPFLCMYCFHGSVPDKRDLRQQKLYSVARNHKVVAILPFNAN